MAWRAGFYGGPRDATMQFCTSIDCPAKLAGLSNAELPWLHASAKLGIEVVMQAVSRTRSRVPRFRLTDPASDFNGSFAGQRMSADEFLTLSDDGSFYELIDGVVVVSPSPSPLHNTVMLQIARQLSDYLDDHPVGRAYVETDVHLRTSPDGRDLVYRPEIVFVRTERLREVVIPRRKIVGAPDLVVEVVSRGSRRIDTTTKKRDYEECGVREYWLIDPDRDAMTFFRLRRRRYVKSAVHGARFASEAVPGFFLDLSAVRTTFNED